MPGACLNMPGSPVAMGKQVDMFKEHAGFGRSDSGRNIHQQVIGIRRSNSDNHLCCYVNRIRASSSSKPLMRPSRSFGIFPLNISGSSISNSLKSFLFDHETGQEDLDVTEKEVTNDENRIEMRDEEKEEEEEDKEVDGANWVERLLEIQSHWRSKQQNDGGADEGDDRDENENVIGDCDCDEGGCEVNYESDGEERPAEAIYDRESFSKLLAQVPWSDTKQFSQLAFLSNMAYVITDLKAEDLKRYYGLKFVTSSLERKAEAAEIIEEIDRDSVRVPLPTPEIDGSGQEKAGAGDDADQRRSMRSSAAYEIAASAATYVQSRAKDVLLPCGSKLQLQEADGAESSCEEGEREGNVEGSHRVYNSEVAAYMTAQTITAVVAAGEEQKQEAAKDLQSLHSSPCEWFICHDLCTYTRCFVIQGSDSLASWQANLFFEPTKFEDTDVLVHRGIYEAAKGIYDQFLPEIMEHLETHGDRAKLQFTGHSLGGSLSLLVHLMLLSRGVVKPSSLRPVVTFGSPFVFCGGKRILHQLGLDQSHVHNVMMHRDIVPRAFSCKYPNHAALLLKRLHGSFRSHPCLLKNKHLYSPMGKVFILQPHEKSSPSHPLLPPGNALYALDTTKSGYSPKALEAFLNSPHPLETLSHPTAYGKEGSILRDHDSSNYLKAVNDVLRQHKKPISRKANVDKSPVWPLLISPSPRLWGHDRFVEARRLVNQEVMTGA